MRILGAAAVLALALAPAQASTINNADTKAYELRIETRDGARLVQAEPGATLEKICPEGCTITLVGVEDATYTLEGNEIVSIEGGLVYFDRELPNADGDGAEPPAGR